MTSAAADWRPATSAQRLRARATLLARVREFFAGRGVLEVDTPILVNSPVSDAQLHSAAVQLPGLAAPLYLHTSPEYAMKRLLAAESGDIFQICHVVRGAESGRLHNPEFTLIEWYRLGFSLDLLMEEVERLVRLLLCQTTPARDCERLSYREVFLRELAIDPLTAGEETLAAAAGSLGFRPPAARAVRRDEWLDLLMGLYVGPRLGRDRLTFVCNYPASQAALARLDPADARIAERFELYCEGLELANGFHELASVKEQRARFEADNAARRRAGLPVAPLDERFLAALAAGLPDCVGVALGFDRTLMLAVGAQHIDEVLPFPTARA
ncbi:MAG: EF-P lysine aminoacylase GenX [Gammaproteobacteria bacterium]|nr:EF-P lysine aminoacylase GenX [Gammaproteobacteria bacterium]